MTTHYDFEDTDNFDLVYQFLELFKESFDDEAKLECLLDCAAYAIHGTNFNEKFLSLVGLSGRNGKGLFDTLMKNTLGTYYNSISADYFIG